MDAHNDASANEASAAKRKRSPSASQPASAPVAKAAKPANQLSINYLARQSQDDLPLIGKDESLPNLLHLLSQYSNILDRHESLASNLGARPLGPILIKRFERCFDAPPKIVASHHKGAASNPEESPHQITWLEVIEFARSHPAQFTLSTFSEGKRVCQFYYPQKQLRVQVSEEDFLFINSGRCQELIPPLPIWEDEEKEVATCDVLEAKLKELTNAADMVAARTRQLSHRLKGRRAAILERRAEGGSGTPAKATVQQTTTAPSATGSGFTPVNATSSTMAVETVEPTLGSSTSVRNELLRHFESLPHNQNQGRSQSRHLSVAVPHSTQQDTRPPASDASSLSPVPPNAFNNDFLTYYTTDGQSASGYAAGSALQRPSSSGGHGHASGSTPLKHNFSRPLPPALESSQPFRPLCQAHMDGLPRGQRVMPPCDRCRRLRMDCVKNLTSCAGCTRKHARCHWRDVSREELGELDHLMESAYSTTAVSPPNGFASTQTNGYTHAGSDLGDPTLDGSDDDTDDDSNPLEDLEALEEKEELEDEAAAERVKEDAEDLRQVMEKEDEEGLRQARDLARQGWEESLKSHQMAVVGATMDSVLPSHTAPANGEIVQNGVLDTGLPLPVPTNQDAVQHTNPVVLHNGLGGNTAVPVAESNHVDVAEIAQVGRDVGEQSVPLPASYGGFRAVNDVTPAVAQGYQRS